MNCCTQAILADFQNFGTKCKAQERTFFISKCVHRYCVTSGFKQYNKII